MDYFTELLESYSLSKKRKLKLVEQDDSQSAADEALKAAQAQNPEPRTSNPFIVPTPRTQYGLAIFVTPKGWKFSPADSQGLPVMRGQKFIQQAYNEFVGYFSQDQAGEAEPQGQDPMAQPGADMAATMPIDPDVADADVRVIQGLQEASMLAPKVVKNLVKKVWDAWAGNRGYSPSTYISGGAQHSLERQINGVERAKLNSKGEVIVFKDIIDSATRIDAVNKIKRLFTVLSNNTPDRGSLDDRAFITKNFEVNSDGSVTVITGPGESGIVFGDGTGFLKMILESSSQQFNLRITKRKKIKEDTGEMNNIRGVLREQIIPLIDAARVAISFQRKGIDASHTKKYIAKYYRQVKDKLDAISQANEYWTKIGQDQALTTEEKSVVEALSAFASADSMATIKRLVQLETMSMSQRDPDIRLHVGNNSGNGERSDILEGYLTIDKARQSLLNSGFRPDQVDSMLTQTTLEELAQTGYINSEMLRDYQELYKVDPNDVLFMPSVSLKAYKNLSRVKAGTVHSASHMKVFKDDPNTNPFLKKGLEAIAGLGNDPLKVKQEMSAYMDQYEKIYQSVHAIRSNLTVRNSDGTIHKEDAIKQLQDSAFRLIAEDSSFFETYGVVENKANGRLQASKTLKSELAELCKTELKSTNSDMTNEDLELKLKNTLVSYMRNRKLELDLKAQDPMVRLNATRSLAFKLWTSAGTAKETFVEAQGLETNESFRFIQNDIVRDVINSVITGNGKWNVVPGKSDGIFYFKQAGGSASIEMRDQIDRDSGRIAAKTYSFMNKACMQMFHVKSQKNAFESFSVDGLLEQFNAFQQEFMSKILQLKK